jgi:electron transfer flavoprotein alpha subunit
MIKTKKNKEIKIKEIKLFKKREKDKTIDKEKETKERSFDSNKVSMKDILNSYDCNSSHRKVKVYKYKYGDYAKNNAKYNHPQLYTLNNTFRTRNIFPTIGPQKALNTFHDFTNLIPEKRINKREFNKQIYKAYKTMKTKNNNEKGILI